ncbi:hypothetical protein Nocox_33040 [Nonomuraea coxensis DSM 45129]|uniref:Uncharacterized protein n=1 Tax=Nonomuraea coxensis DSM 45129 TaxID=1122611 RepID=A0ABX8U8W5_9ACTN|nr:hypothetical protein [Nonomuraea coxensis]QYC44178.1 hypothetical protein Nocox_33040 [Nonomuraea coxensis DSM 45129]
MKNTGFGTRERAVLLGLMTLGGTASNAELKAHVGCTLDGQPRRRLNTSGLVTSEKPGRSYHHTLTDDGWAWCVTELDGTAPDRGGSLGRTLYGVLHLLRGYLDAADLSLAEFVITSRRGGAGAAPAEPPAELPGAIRDAYWRLAREPQDWVPLKRLRAELGDVPREAADEALRRLERLPDVHLAPEADQKRLTDEDRTAAVLVGGVSKHLLAIEAR